MSYMSAFLNDELPDYPVVCSCGFIGKPNLLTLQAANEPMESRKAYNSYEEMVADIMAEDDEGC